MADFEYRGAKVSVDDDELAGRLPSDYKQATAKTPARKTAPAKSEDK